VERDRALSGEVEQPLGIRDARVDRGGVRRRDLDPPDEVGEVLRSVLLHEALARYTVGISFQRQRPIHHVRQHDVRHRCVVLDDPPFGNAREVLLVRIRDVHLPILANARCLVACKMRLRPVTAQRWRASHGR